MGRAQRGGRGTGPRDSCGAVLTAQAAGRSHRPVTTPKATRTLVTERSHSAHRERSPSRPIRKIQVGSNPSDLTIDPQNDTVYVPNFFDDDASVFPTSKSPPAVSRAG